MPCNNCQKIISKVAEDTRNEKEIIKNLINCEICSKEIIARCHTCHWPIYKNELIYESSRDSSSGNIFIIRIIGHLIFKLKSDNPEKVTQCNWCYRAWKNDFKEREKKLKRKEWLLDLPSPFLIISFLSLFYPGWLKRILDEFEWFKKCNHPYGTIVFCSFIASFCLMVWIDKIEKKIPKAYRYKRRYRKGEKK